MSIRFLKRAAVVVCLLGSASSLAQEVAPAPFEVVPSLLDKAKEYIGVPYRPGGVSPSGFDCSGFVRFVFRAFGVQLNRSSRSQATQGEKVAPGEIQPGDLLFFRIRGNRIGHVGIYLGGGQFIHAGSRGGPSVRGVKIARLDSSFYARRLVSARRVMTAGAGTDGTPAPAPVQAVPGDGLPSRGRNDRMRLVRALAVLLGISLPVVAAEPPGEVRTVTIAAVGDTMVGSVFPNRSALPPASGQRVFERVRDLWSGADIVTGNLEGTISSDPSAARALGKNSYRFLMPPESLAIYRDAGFNVLCVANNHAMDAGPSARSATLEALDEAGIAHGGSLDRPATVLTTASGVKVGFVAAAPHMGCFPLDPERSRRK